MISPRRGIIDADPGLNPSAQDNDWVPETQDNRAIKPYSRKGLQHLSRSPGRDFLSWTILTLDYLNVFVQLQLELVHRNACILLDVH
jgi:hypothetical protein